MSARRYVFIPDGLILAFAHDPLAVGVYAAIARLVVAAKIAVPLAARDLVAWIGSQREADRVAIMRRIVKLEERGWVIATRTRASKHWLLPTWGRDQDGAVRPWRPGQLDSGRPAHMRGRRVPLDLFDGYIGRLDPRSGQCPALISRYFNQPLLDLTDVGVYVVSLRAEVTPTPRLRHLGLHNTAGVTAPVAPQSLMRLAEAGRLTTIVGDEITSVSLSFQGQSQCGILAVVAGVSGEGASEQPGRSAGRSAGGSNGMAQMSVPDAEHSAQNMADTIPDRLIAWDVGSVHEQTNYDSPSVPPVSGGESATTISESGSVSGAVALRSGITCAERGYALYGETPGTGRLADTVIEGHRRLNPGRLLSDGEWRELLALQEDCGVERLLIWQARAGRSGRERPLGITPGYYRACAGRAASEVFRTDSCSAATDLIAGVSATALPPSALDPACDELLRSMGVRERQKLADVSHALITVWQEALQHPGLAAQFASPIGFAVAQMQRGNQPPCAAELDRWAERVRRGTDRYETWRHVEPLAIDNASVGDEHQLEARVRALAPREADVDDLCALAEALEAGASDAEALARLRLRRDCRSEHERHCHAPC